MSRIDVRPPAIYSYVIDPILSYGAKGDGSTDDSTAINNALTYAGTIGGTVQLRPNVTYAVGATINVPANANLAGGGLTSRILATSNIGTIIKSYSASVASFNGSMRDFSFYVADNVTCDYGLVIDGAVGMYVENVRACYPGSQGGSSGILTTAFYFNNTFRCTFNHLSTFAHRVTTHCYYFASSLNACLFNELYTSQATPNALFNFYFNDVTGTTSHGNTFNMLTAQGAKYGIRADRWDFGGNAINGFYSENVAIPMSFGSGGATVTPATTSITSGSATATVSSATNVAYGQRITGTGIPDYTYVANISGTTVTMTNQATATNGSASLTFTSGSCIGLSVSGGSYSGPTGANDYYAYRTANIEALNLYGAAFNGVKFETNESTALAPVTITPVGAGSGAAAVARVKPDGTIFDVVVTNPGSGYTTGATVSFGGTGTGATANAATGTVSDVAGTAVYSNAVTSITLTGAGSGFAVPQVPLAILYDNASRVCFTGVYCNHGQGVGSAVWPWIARTGTALTQAGPAMIGDSSGIDRSACDVMKTVGSGYKFAVTTFTSGGIPFSRIFTAASWVG